MKIENTSDSDIFGCVRFGSSTTVSGFGTTKTGRPSMISAKYRLKEERRKVLKISIGKLKRIEDPESSLCRSVLINNTMKRLQREAREEKLQRQGIYQPQQTIFIESNEATPRTDFTKTTTTAEVIHPIVPAIESAVKDEITPQLNNNNNNNNNNNDSEVNMASTNKKRSNGGGICDECDVQDVLSHFYMPPTPRLLTSIDDEDDILPPKRQRLESIVPSNNEDITIDETPSLVESSSKSSSSSDPSIQTTSSLCEQQSNEDDEDEVIDVVNESSFDSTDFSTRLTSSAIDTEQIITNRIRDLNNDDFNDRRCNSSICNTTPQQSSTSSSTTTNPSIENTTSTTEQHFSCGHSSIFGELQSVVFHSLIASLES